MNERGSRNTELSMILHNHINKVRNIYVHCTITSLKLINKLRRWKDMKIY